MTREEIREEICNSMTLQDAIRVLKETNCYGTMDIAKSVIINTFEKMRDEIMKLQTYKMFTNEDTVYIERNDVLKIIDEHKTESEAEDAHSN